MGERVQVKRDKCVRTTTGEQSVMESDDKGIQCLWALQTKRPGSMGRKLELCPSEITVNSCLICSNRTLSKRQNFWVCTTAWCQNIYQHWAPLITDTVEQKTKQKNDSGAKRHCYFPHQDILPRACTGLEVSESLVPALLSPLGGKGRRKGDN